MNRKDRLKVWLKFDKNVRAAITPKDLKSTKALFFVAMPESGNQANELESYPDEEPDPAGPSAAVEPPKPAPPMIAPPKVLKGVVRMAGGVGPFGGGDVSVRNTDDFAWTNCYVVKDRRQRGRLGILPAGKERTVKNFSTHADYFVEKGKVGVFCEEGEVITTPQ